HGTECVERLTPEDRISVVNQLAKLRRVYPKIYMPEVVLQGYLNPPASPEECVFSKTTECVSADLVTQITPCQFGGEPVCTECGCIASAGLACFSKYKIAGVLPVSSIFEFSQRIGEFSRRIEQRVGAMSAAAN